MLGAIADLRRFATPGYVALLVCSTLALLGGIAAHELGSRAGPPPAAARGRPGARSRACRCRLGRRSPSALGSLDPAYRIRFHRRRPDRRQRRPAAHRAIRSHRCGDPRRSLAARPSPRRRRARLSARSAELGQLRVPRRRRVVHERAARTRAVVRRSRKARGDRLTLSLALSGNLHASLHGDRQVGAVHGARENCNRLPRPVCHRRAWPPVAGLARPRSRPVADPRRHDGGGVPDPDRSVRTAREGNGRDECGSRVLARVRRQQRGRRRPRRDRRRRRRRGRGARVLGPERMVRERVDVGAHVERAGGRREARILGRDLAGRRHDRGGRDRRRERIWDRVRVPRERERVDERAAGRPAERLGRKLRRRSRPLGRRLEQRLRDRRRSTGARQLGRSRAGVRRARQRLGGGDADDHADRPGRRRARYLPRNLSGWRHPRRRRPDRDREQ